MKKLCVIGEALIDFIPEAKGKRLKDVGSFKKVAGGAPANVAAAVTRLGGRAKIVTQLGEDAFGDFIKETLANCGVETDDIHTTKEGDTGLAFVSLADDGNRDFKFYRRTCADKMLHPSMVNEETLRECGILHFCSVDLIESPMKYTHKKLIELALDQNMLISFDPNVRLSLWDDPDSLRNTIHEFIPYAHILKLSDEELEFITGETSLEQALPQLFTGNVQCLIYTRGKDGAVIYHKGQQCGEVEGHSIEAVDTTGAGDSFIGAFLYKLLEDHVDNLETISSDMLKTDLEFANRYAAHTATKEGAISALATQEELEAFTASLQK